MDAEVHANVDFRTIAPETIQKCPYWMNCNSHQRFYVHEARDCAPVFVCLFMGTAYVQCLGVIWHFFFFFFLCSLWDKLGALMINLRDLGFLCPGECCEIAVLTAKLCLAWVTGCLVWNPGGPQGPALCPWPANGWVEAEANILGCKKFNAVTFTFHFLHSPTPPPTLLHSLLGSTNCVQDMHKYNTRAHTHGLRSHRRGWSLAWKWSFALSCERGLF